MLRRPSGISAGTECVGESVDKGLAAEALPVARLDKPEAAIIDQPARPQRLDSEAVQNHLRDLGFPPALGVLWRGPAAAKEPFRRPALARAEEGLLHVIGRAAGARRGAYRVREKRPPVAASAASSLFCSGCKASSNVWKPPVDWMGATEDRDGPIGTAPLYLDGRIGQCVTRAVPKGWNGARVFKIECDRWIRWQ